MAFFSNWFSCFLTCSLMFRKWEVDWACFPMPVRTFWVYSDESKNRQSKRMWNACLKGWFICQQMILSLEWLWALDRLGSSRLRDRSTRTATHAFWTHDRRATYVVLDMLSKNEYYPMLPQPEIWMCMFVFLECKFTIFRRQGDPHCSFFCSFEKFHRETQQFLGNPLGNKVYSWTFMENAQRVLENSLRNKTCHSNFIEKQRIFSKFHWETWHHLVNSSRNTAFPWTTT